MQPVGLMQSGLGSLLVASSTAVGTPVQGELNNDTVGFPVSLRQHSATS
jgi:hypothetical protein